MVNPRDTNPTPAERFVAICAELGELAFGALEGSATDPARLQIVELSNDLTRPSSWRVTLRSRDAVATSPTGVASAGGEIFVDVDLATSEVHVRFGE